MESLSAQIMIKALDGLVARQAVTAQNIANAGTPGYRPLQLSFERALADAAAQGSDAVAAVTPRIEQSDAAMTDTALRVDLEVAGAAATALRYAALIDLLNRRLQIEALAISGVR
jgi:flagellar basal-body rod protein FlgB